MAFAANQRVRVTVLNNGAADGCEWMYGNVVTGKSREMLRDGIGHPDHGSTEPHVRVDFDGCVSWYPVETLESVN